MSQTRLGHPAARARQGQQQLLYDWLLGQSLLRPDSRQPAVHLCDGQEALWQARGDYLPDKNAVDILTLLRDAAARWQAAKLFYGERSPQVVPFVRHRVTQYGKVEGVVRGLRRWLRSES